ncbi:MAG: hypothetical protein AAB869_00985, partial [Patescibacteria group bacterium]
MTAFFNKKNTALKKETKNDSNKTVSINPPSARPFDDPIAKKAGGLDMTMVLIRPHVTEKATNLSGRGIYVFEINKFANK